ncbi:DEAH (Asp-Glu-Ala-His) box polypeptide 34, partial [Lobulomyces angularis]
MSNFRYNIDGSRRLETEKETLERKNSSFSRGGQKQNQIFKNEIKWERNLDNMYFNPKDGIASFKRFSIKYDEFKIFFEKFKAAQKKNKSFNDPFEEMKEALKYFDIFNEKKLKNLVKKVKLDRANLPVANFKENIIEKINSNQVILIAADTGAGKSTQVPQFLLEAGFDKIAVTQPRRIACYSLAKRVGYERVSETNSLENTEIGYKVRFEGSQTKDTKVLFLTEGVLLRQFASDNKLSSYNVVIIDEVHERHITGDFLLGVLKRLVQTRDDIKIILMSATINAELFSSYFFAPVITIPGRMFPVQIHYLPFEKDDRNLCDPKIIQERSKQLETVSITSSKKSKQIEAKVYLSILDRIDKSVPSEEKGDLLIFLAGISEITDLYEHIKVYAKESGKWIVLMLHSTLGVAEQEKVFDIPPDGVRKCVLSTNIAETSVTIDGIRFIIDSGRVKEMSYNAEVGLSKLSEFWISQSSAKQRAGRAGRTGPGECFRLYSQNEYNQFNEYPVPEILRTQLESTLLQIVSFDLELEDPRNFEFIQQPSQSSMNFALERLINLDALEKLPGTQEYGDEFVITPLGKMLSLLPLDCVLGKMLLWGSCSQLIYATVVVVASLSIQSPFSRTEDSIVLNKRQELFSDHGDPFTSLNLFSDWLRIKSDKTESSRAWCRRRGCEEQRLYEMVKLKSQFEDILARYMAKEGESDDEEEFGFVDSGLKKRKSKFFEENDPEFRKKRRTEQILKKKKILKSGNKRKILSLDDEINDFDDQNNYEELNDMTIDELEFTLKQDAEQLLQKTDVTNLTSVDVGLIKLIICSGLYPHFAIADENNHNKMYSEQIFHTKTKRFISMHPTSVFYYKPEIIFNCPNEDETNVIEEERNDTEVETLKTIHAPSPKGSEILVYLSLLETTKPYLTNVFRVSAMPACLLFCQAIKISTDFKDIICDEWLHLRMPDTETGIKLLTKSNFLRVNWNFIVDSNLINLNEEEIQQGLCTNNDEQLNAVTFGTLIKDINQDAPEERKEKKTNDIFERVNEEVDLEQYKLPKYIPDCFNTIRKDWLENFGKIDEWEILQQLGDFMYLNACCTVERAKVLELESTFEKDVPLVQITQNIFYYVGKKRSKYVFENFIPPRPKPKRKTRIKREGNAMPILVNEVKPIEKTLRKCDICSKEMTMNSIEFLKHKRE